MQGSAAFPLLELSFPTLDATSAQAVTSNRVSVAPSNPWGLQEVAMPLMEISHPEGATKASVTYSPVEDLSLDVSLASKLSFGGKHAASVRCSWYKSWQSLSHGIRLLLHLIMGPTVMQYS